MFWFQEMLQSVGISIIIFTDVSAERAVRVFSKVGFMIVTREKHIGMSDGTHRITIPGISRNRVSLL